MIAAPARTKTTFDKYAALEESNQTIELIDGEIIVTATFDAHTVFLIRLILLFGALQKSAGLRIAPGGLYIDDLHSFEPDIFWISPENDRCFLRPDNRYWQGAPDLVIEILSPSTAYRDRGIKFRTYQTLGVREYWLADGEAQFIEVYTLQDGKFVQVGVCQSGEPFQSAALDATIDVTPLFA
jgi:Uma2 family endonuclease